MTLEKYKNEIEELERYYREKKDIMYRSIEALFHANGAKKTTGKRFTSKLEEAFNLGLNSAPVELASHTLSIYKSLSSMEVNEGKCEEAKKGLNQLLDKKLDALKDLKKVQRAINKVSITHGGALEALENFPLNRSTDEFELLIEELNREVDILRGQLCSINERVPFKLAVIGFVFNYLSCFGITPPQPSEKNREAPPLERFFSVFLGACTSEMRVVYKIYKGKKEKIYCYDPNDPERLTYMNWVKEVMCDTCPGK